MKYSHRIRRKAAANIGLLPTPRFVAHETATFTSHQILHTSFSKNQNRLYRFHKNGQMNNDNPNHLLPMSGCHSPD